jgi:uncharacterized protein YfdQ (DUF2303 family)
MPPNDEGTSGAQAIIEAGLHLGDIRKTSAGREFVVLPEGSALRDLDLLLDNPRRQKASVAVTEVDSFIRYLKAFGGSNARTFAAINPEAGTAIFSAILDYHEGNEGTAGWGGHRVTFQAIQTPEWKVWSKNDRKPVGQSEFARFVEDNLGDIVQPDGAQMLEIAKTLEAKTSVDFKSGIRLENGDHHLHYVTETTGRAGGKGELEIPGTFVLGIAPFQGGPAYKVSARLRYRISEGHLSLWYELVSPHKVVEAACKEIVDTINSETGQQAFMGVAPAIG